MTRLRVIIFISTILVVIAAGSLFAFYARGYRFNPDSLKFTPNGILVAKSVPDGAQIILNGEFKTATNATIPLPPETYDVNIIKEGFLDWNKRLVIEKEVVTQLTAHLFKSAPSLSAVTFSGISTTVPSSDMSKVAFIVPPSPNDASVADENSGLWVIEMVNLPVGFSRDPRRITDGDLVNSTFTWSPNGREILLDTTKGSFLLKATNFTPQVQRVNIAETKNEILTEWEEKKETKLKAQLNKLPDKLVEIFNRKTSAIVFSPDEDMVLYTASGSATIEPDLIPQLPGSSTQKQERNIKDGHTYVYDIKEDRNFLIDSGSAIILGGSPTSEKRRLSWFATSRHVVMAESNKVVIMDYDATNQKEVYSGSFEAPNAFPTLSTDRLLLLTNLGANSSPPNLYSLSLK